MINKNIYEDHIDIAWGVGIILAIIRWICWLWLIVSGIRLWIMNDTYTFMQIIKITIKTHPIQFLYIVILYIILTIYKIKKRIDYHKF